MLDQAGFNTNSLHYCVLKLDRDIDNQERRRIDAELVKATAENNLRGVESDEDFLESGNLDMENYSGQKYLDDFREAFKASV